MNVGLWDGFLRGTNLSSFFCGTLPEFHLFQQLNQILYQKNKPLLKDHFETATRLMNKFYVLCQTSFSLQNGKL